MHRRYRFHPVFELAYLPRMVAHIGAALLLACACVTAGTTTELLSLLAFSLTYPHLVYWVVGRWCGSQHHAWQIQGIDSVYVGFLCGVFQLSPWALLSLLSSLLLSNTVLFGMRGVLQGLLGVVVGYLLQLTCWGYLVQPVAGVAMAWTSALYLLSYGTLLTWLVYSWGSAVRETRSSHRRQHQAVLRVIEQIKKYIAPQVHQLVAEDSYQVTRSARRKPLTVFFSDIQGFTTLAEHLEAEQLSDLLNEYLQAMADIAIRFGGTIDKYMGDGIMVFFGDPKTRGQQQDALACVQMAIAMRRKVVQLRPRWLQRGITEPLHVRMGIHSGFCTVGNFGSELRMDYTAIGQGVNLASRLESAAGADEVLVSRETYLLVRDRMKCLRRPGLQVKGVSRPVVAYQLVGERHPADHLYLRQQDGLQLVLDADQVDREQLASEFERAVRWLASRRQQRSLS